MRGMPAVRWSAWPAWLLAAAALLQAGAVQAAPGAPAVQLEGYTDRNGAITVLHGGDSADPYFAMQALLLAHDNGLDITASAEKFITWLLPKQKPDGTFDRFCRQANGDWLACRTADADDSLLAMWMRLLDTLPAQLAARPDWANSHRIAKASLARLYQPSRAVYMVSPVYLHGLFMDNLEVWALKQQSPDPALRAQADVLSKAIYATFWQPVDARFLVSTQLEQRGQAPAFYPDHVAQLFPLLVGFPLPAAAGHYRTWMQQHRAEWLRHGEKDYPWGIIAVAAMRQGDVDGVRCWLRETAGMRHSARWAVSDEVSLQVVTARGLKPAAPRADCT
ncbi:MAG: hypothetical protein Q7T87_04265 [Polaromonas sp.]|nr:hypothetical protein [Polaromonas sp.]